MDLSIVISLYNEEESLPELIEWIVRVVNENKYSYEIILVDDGSNDKSWSIIEKHAAQNEHIRGIKFKRNYGKSAALHNGFAIAQGEFVITMDADLQDSPDEIPELVKKIKDENLDIVSGWKKKRYDPKFTKNLPSKLFNWTARKVTKIKLHDFNCGLKIYRKEVVKSIELYGDMHRYIPALAKQAGFSKIDEKVVVHQKRKYGVSKFGMERFVNGFLDLLSIGFISRFSKRPMHFFGLLGFFSFLIGFLILAYLAFAKIFFNAYQMTERPLFYLGFLSIIFGTQLFLTGFISELVSRSSPERNVYQIDKKI